MLMRYQYMESLLKAILIFGTLCHSYLFHVLFWGNFLEV